MPRLALEIFVQSFGIADFSITGKQVRVGTRFWRAVECRCGIKGCEGWEMIPMREEPRQAVTADLDQAAR